jgi:hypothetical protein
MLTNAPLGYHEAVDIYSLSSLRSYSRALAAIGDRAPLMNSLMAVRFLSTTALASR